MTNHNKTHLSHKNFFLLVIILTIAPFIFFLGKNFLNTEFFSSNFFYVAIIYCLFFLCLASCAVFFTKKIKFLVLFSTYFSFLQFYFFYIQKFLIPYIDGSTGYYVLILLVFISFIATLSSNLLIFRNFIIIFLFLNILISINNLIPTIIKISKALFKNTNVISESYNLKNFISTKHPNIFYIVPDGLASPKILKNYADIDYSVSIKNFETKGFSVSYHNYSSYNSTHLSLAALFEMDYPLTEKSQEYKETSNFYPNIRERKPKLTHYLKANNYKFVIIPPLWGGCPKAKEYICLMPSYDSYLASLYQDYSIRMMFENSLIGSIFKRYFKLKDMDDSGKTALNHMKANPKFWSEGGLFTMIHMFIPHTPYREENCSFADRYPVPSKEGYKSSVYCAFNRIHELTDFIIKNDPNASIVIQSDHGLYSKIIHKNKNFIDISYLSIDHRLASFAAVRGCGSKESVKLNQANIVKYTVECLVGRKPKNQFENKSYFELSKDSPGYGKVFRVFQK